MAYKQNNNPFQKTSCGRRRNYMTTENSTPMKKGRDPKHSLSPDLVKAYENVGVPEMVLNELNAKPSDTVTSGTRNFKHINRQLAALKLAGKDSGIVQLYKSPGEEVETKVTGRGKKRKEEIVNFMGDLTYTKDDKEALASTVAKKKKKPNVRNTTKGKGRNFRTTKEGAGMTSKGIKAYRAKNPGSKLKKAVTGKVKKGSKAAKRRKSFCARSKGWTGPRGKAARRRWKC